MELDVDVAKLKLMESSHNSQRFLMEDRLRKEFPCAIAQTEQNIKLLDQDAAMAEKTREQDFSITILGKTYGLDADGKPQKQEAGEALLAAAQTLGKSQGTIGEYRGFKMSFSYDTVFNKVNLQLSGATVHLVELGISVSGNLQRIENAVENISKRLDSAREKLANLHEQVRTAEEEVGKEFPRAQELQEKSARLAALNIALTVQDGGQQPAEAEEAKHEITEGDIVALDLVESPKVHLKPYTKGNFFDGEVAHVDTERGYCVQKVGNSLTVHRLEALETVPELGENVRVTYPKDESRKAEVTVKEQRQRCHRIA